ncbi:MAG: hypothetical protein AB7O26_10590 [Planctomycetaceae bacterium]
MRRARTIFLWLAAIALLGGGAFAFFWAIRQTPEFYESVIRNEPAPEVRRDDAKVFVQRTLSLVEGMQHADKWAEAFTQSQINSWLSEELQPKYGAFVPEGVSNPRVRLADETIEVGFRYKHEHWDSIVSVKTRPWVPKPNSLAFEIQSIRAGLIPIPLESIIQDLSKQFEVEGYRVEWSEANGNDVVILHLTKSGDDQPVLESVKVVKGSITVAGRRKNARSVNATAERDTLIGAPVRIR